MKSKRILFERLRKRYLLVLRNEESLAESRTVPFTMGKLILGMAIVFLLIFAGSLFLSKTILARWFDPQFAQAEQRKQLIELTRRIDSLALEEDRKEKFIENFQRILRGDTSGGFTDPVKTLASSVPLTQLPTTHPVAADSQFRKEFEQAHLNDMRLEPQENFRDVFFFPPINGLVSDKYNSKTGHYGVDVVTKSNEPVKCVADGMVVMDGWTQEFGYVLVVQHINQFISVYKHNARLLKKTGNFVNAGDIISVVGNTGELSDGPHLHFELWYNGRSLNPEEFVTF